MGTNWKTNVEGKIDKEGAANTERSTETKRRKQKGIHGGRKYVEWNEKRRGSTRATHLLSIEDNTAHCVEYDYRDRLSLNKGKKNNAANVVQLCTFLEK